MISIVRRATGAFFANPKPPIPPATIERPPVTPPAPQDDGKPYGIPLDMFDDQIRYQLAEHRRVAEKAGLPLSEHWVLENLAHLSTKVSPLRAAQLMFGGPSER